MVSAENPNGAKVHRERQGVAKPVKYPTEKLILLTAREAAGYLRVSLSTLHRMERRGLLNPLRTPGGHRRYTLEMLNECLTYTPVRPVQEAPA